MWEKLLHIHDQPFQYRAVARLPLCAFMLFLAIAFPFFGAINAILGAFTTSFGTYIIPTIGYNLAFSSADGLVREPFIDITWIRRINRGVAIFVLVFGVGAGGFMSIKNFLEQLETFDYMSSVINVKTATLVLKLLNCTIRERKICFQQ
jgi:auxin influx carrier (AUX1 LAX family)